MRAGLTKRQLGFLFILAGFGGAAVVFAVDLFGAGQFQGIGPAQRLALGGAAAGILIGLSLVPLGNRPA